MLAPPAYLTKVHRFQSHLWADGFHDQKSHHQGRTRDGLLPNRRCHRGDEEGRWISARKAARRREDGAEQSPDAASS